MSAVTKRWGDVSPGELVLGEDGGIVAVIRTDGAAMLSDEDSHATHWVYRDLDDTVAISEPF